LGRDAIVTMHMKLPVDANTLVPRMTAPAEIAADTPPVRVIGEQQISWRIRPVAQTSGRLRFVAGNETLEKETPLRCWVAHKFIAPIHLASG
jgi:hypothetical protein